jgi:DNA-binding CsgD family transcriptional regulator
VERSFLERDEEMTALGRWLDDVRESGAGMLILVAGEAGVGKTTLVRCFRESRSRSRAIVGVCDPLTTPAPLGPVVEIAAGLDGRAAQLVAGEARPHEVGRALLVDLASERGAVIVLEDLHWADEGSIDVLVYVARRIERAPALLIGTYRDDALDPSHPLRSALGLLATAPRVERLSLRPLSLEAVRTLSATTGQDGDLVFATTGGNPFFVSELLTSPPGEVPATVRDVVLGRRSLLGSDAQMLVDIVSVVPPQAELWLLDALEAAPVEALEQCVSAGVLERRGECVSFRHELARLAVEQAVSADTAVALHRKVLAALEDAGAEPARLVHHAEAAGDTTALLRYAIAAGSRSADLGAHREAAEQYARALSAATALPEGERAGLLSRYAYERYLTDRLDEAILAQGEAVNLLRAAGDRAGEGDGLRQLSRFLWFGGRRREAEEAALQAVAALEELSPGPELARAYSNASQLRMLAHDNEAAIDWGTRALELAESCGAEDIVVHALANVGAAEVQAGLEAVGRAKLEDSLARALAEGLEDDVGRAYANLAAQAVERRQFALADRYLANGVAYCDEHDLVSYGVYLRAWLARLALDSGRWTVAGDIAEEVLGNTKASPPSKIVAGVVAGLLAARRGETDRGHELLQRARAIASPIGELQRLAPVAAARAEAAWLLGDTPGVDEATATVVELAAERGQPWHLGDLIVWRRRAGLRTPTGEVSPPASAELAGKLEEAASLWSDLGCPYEAALALAGAAEEAQLRRAHAELRRLGAKPAERIVARRLRALGVHGIPRGPYSVARLNPAGLTAREIEVLDLLGESLGNAEIARRLVVSPRTIDHHVSRILAKLEVRTRTEAVAKARSTGILKDPSSEDEK